MEDFKTYLVGGAVRDELLGRPVTDRDWVVVGATPDDMLARGFKQVGADFPVFLHPDTAEEYALARTERRQGHGHKGFVVHFDRDVTLVEDLARRDLTINAMAKGSDGELIDPYGGANDLRDGLLRAVTQAFQEDPLRVFRVARFAAQLPGFEVADATLELMRGMVRDRRLDELPGERIWQELNKVLHAADGAAFWRVIDQVDAWLPFFLEWSDAQLTHSREFEGSERFALWCEPLDRDEIDRLSDRLRVPNEVRDFARAVGEGADLLCNWPRTEAPALDVVLTRARAYQHPDRYARVLRFVERRHRVDLARLEQAIRLMPSRVSPAAHPNVQGVALGAALRVDRIEVLREAQD